MEEKYVDRLFDLLEKKIVSMTEIIEDFSERVVQIEKNMIIVTKDVEVLVNEQKNHLSGCPVNKKEFDAALNEALEIKGIKLPFLPAVTESVVEKIVNAAVELKFAKQPAERLKQNLSKTQLLSAILLIFTAVGSLIVSIISLLLK